MSQHSSFCRLLSCTVVTFPLSYRIFYRVDGAHKRQNLHYTRGITPKRVTSGEAHLRDLAPGQHSSEETSQRWRAVDNTVPDLTST